MPLWEQEFNYLVLHEVLDTEEQVRQSTTSQQRQRRYAPKKRSKLTVVVQDIMSHFSECLSFIHEARNQDGTVLVVWYVPPASHLLACGHSMNLSAAWPACRAPPR